MKPPYKADRTLIFMADVICISQESIGSCVSSDPLIFSDKQGNVIAGFLVVDIPLYLCACFAVLALALPMEEMGVNRIVFVHSRRRKILL
jgi:hypothetical protein